MDSVGFLHNKGVCIKLQITCKFVGRFYLIWPGLVLKKNIRITDVRSGKARLALHCIARVTFHAQQFLQSKFRALVTLILSLLSS